MHMDYGLKQELTQKLVMTPQLRQAIAILQLSSLELAEMVETELLENPVLEVEERKQEEPDNPETDDRKQVDLAEQYLEWAKYMDEGIDTGFGTEDYAEKPSADVFGEDRVLLHEHLEFQLHIAVLEEKARTIGEFLIGCIDDNGYLRVTVAEAAQTIKVPEYFVEEVLAIIQTFDPLGVGARDLRECLLLQLGQRAQTDTIAAAIIDRHLDDVAAGRYKLIADKLNCQLSEVQQAVDFIRTLDPKPGSGFGDSQSCYIQPDITVEKDNGKYVIIINDNSVPRITISPYYRKMVREADTDANAKRFVEGRIHSALWLIRSIDQRRRTLYNVMEAIVQLQQDYFDYGPKFLRPLTMKKVAEQIGVHESTVSRATANKYAATPQGLVSLRAFFSSGVQGMSGEDVAASRVKREIKELITGENSGHPLSDQALANILAQKGITVSRRTVTKYREELSIPASSKRKRY